MWFKEHNALLHYDPVFEQNVNDTPQFQCYNQEQKTGTRTLSITRVFLG